MPRGKGKRNRIEDLSADHFTFRKVSPPKTCSILAVHLLLPVFDTNLVLFRLSMVLAYSFAVVYVIAQHHGPATFSCSK